MAPQQPNYAVYYVTGRDLLPPGVDFFQHLDKALSGGHVSVVQIREKDADNGEFLEVARKAHAICEKHHVPMLVNDNLSVALCLPSSVGLHIGQDDIPLPQARKLLGPDRLIGISVHTVDDAERALAEGVADYAGVGPVYGTQSKAGITDDKVLSPRGAADIVDALQSTNGERRLPCVLIGGINAQTCVRALVGATGLHNYPDGIAVVSAIQARTDPDIAAADLHEMVANWQSRRSSGASATSLQGETASSLVQAASSLLDLHRRSNLGPPLIQTLTSHVSSTLSANIALAFSSSPIMSHQEEEAADLGRVTGGVVLNIGTISAESRRGMKAVGREANKGGKPVVLDPVGVGASAFRKGCVQQILNDTQVTLIKGNAAELSSIAGLSEVASRGVDSGAGSLSDPVGLVKKLARKEKCLVLLTGKTDYLSDGRAVLACENGHPMVGRITGSGCALGVMLAAGMAAACNKAKEEGEGTMRGSASMLVDANGKDVLVGALMGLLSMTIASEKAAGRGDVKGPGSFIPALIDEIANLRPEDLVQGAKLSVVE